MTCVRLLLLSAIAIGLVAHPAEAQLGSNTIRIRALIDGRSILRLSGPTVRWHHLDYAAPGRWNGANDPTTINGTNWFPTWPDVPTPENRFCNCLSSTYTSLAPAIPSIASRYNVEVVSGRVAVTILAQPNASNGYELQVMFDDNVFAGAVPQEIILRRTNLYVTSLSGSSVRLRWDLGDGPPPNRFVLEGGVVPGQTLATIETNSSDPTFSFVAPTGSFYIRVRGYQGTTPVGVTDEILLNVGLPLAPSPPAALNAAVTGSTLGLSWRNTFAGGPPSSLVLEVDGAIQASIPLGLTETFSFAGAPAGVYALRVRARNSSGLSGPSNSVAITIPSSACSGVPQPPQQFLARRIGSEVEVTWEPSDAGSATTGYVLNVSGTFNLSLPLADRQIRATVPSGSYILSVSAVNLCGSSPATATQTVVVP